MKKRYTITITFKSGTKEQFVIEETDDEKGLKTIEDIILGRNGKMVFVKSWHSDRVVIYNSEMIEHIHIVWSN